ncbi:MT-A70-domain-containing protein, partial [Aureobasidium melanogenum]
MATEHDDLYAQLISSALATIRQNYTGPWLLPRTVISQAEHPLPHKRKYDTTSDAESVRDDLLQQLSSDTTSSHTFRWRHMDDQQRAGEPLLETSSRPKYLYNPSNVAPFAFRQGLPSISAIAQIRAPSIWPLNMSPSNSTHRDNLTRTEKSGRSAYQVSPTVWDVRQLIFEMDIDVLLANEGVIAIWITNKPAVRDLVLGEDGLFDSWDVQLEEEWLWIKTTTEGEPVSSLDALWRKPYEVLLVGRKHDPRRSDQHVKLTDTSKVERRTVRDQRNVNINKTTHSRVLCEISWCAELHLMCSTSFLVVSFCYLLAYRTSNA